jgi:glutathione S-transferase
MQHTGMQGMGMQRTGQSPPPRQTGHNRRMYQLFIANKNYSSWSLRPWVLMRSLGIPFEERMEPFADHDNAANFRRFSPTGKVPCLHDGALQVWDSLAIVEYLAERHPGVWPGDPVARAWARCATAEMHAGFGALREHCSMSVGQRIVLRERPAALEADFVRLRELWHQGLRRFGGEFLAGASFTAVDAFFAPVAFRLQTYGIALDPVADAYAARLLALPAMREWQSAALVEPWRERAHEEDLASRAASMEDLRSPPSGHAP